MEDGKSVTACERTGRTSLRCEIEDAIEGRETFTCTSTFSAIDPFEICEKSAVNPEDEKDMRENTANKEEIPQETEIQDVVTNARPNRKAAVEGQAMCRVCKQYTSELLNYSKLSIFGWEDVIS